MERIEESSFLIMASGVIRPVAGIPEDSRKDQEESRRAGDWVWRILFVLILAYGMYAAISNTP